MASKPALKKYMSMDQKQYIVDYMANNIDFANNRFQSLRGKELQVKKWSDLSTSLNALGGATKSSEQWELSWRDLKQKTKTKWLNIHNRQSGENGMLKKKRDVLSEIEKMVLAIMQKDTLDGDGNTQEAGFGESTLPLEITSDEVGTECDIEFLDVELQNVQAGIETSAELDGLTGSFAPVSSRECTNDNHAADSATNSGVTAMLPKGRQIGRGHRYSETSMQKMESKIFGVLEKMQEETQEYRKRKLEMQEKLLNIKERKLATIQNKVSVLNAINENLSNLLQRN
ncbi:uncharacterized protein LOC128745515 [Sabethes cyaneus]|uniref:uncharacterized protein LOC128745515 n=1 Tax=Sabethes cyaneus TaxID=53552 RepID=UPI00237DDABA|nr:uncharacterized protein LOC128745515 [Sabethes cyaneus]